MTQVIVLVGIGILMTVGVPYGIVAAIVKMDDLGLHLVTPTATRPRKPSDAACCWLHRA